ncbi:MAG: ATP-dependent helicase HrpB [Thermodesulfobacteriota bacterium]
MEAMVAELSETLATHACAVLQAPPGAGKTTLVPLYLKDAGWLKGRKILMLAPRRLAARAAATRMARILGEEVGRTVGYRIRMDSRVSNVTRVEVVTEGVLTRMLQNDAALTGVGLVIFDEYHERNLDADLGLALCLDMQGVLNAELRLLIMSATLSSEETAALLGNAPVIRCTGREYPVETRYVGNYTPGESIGTIVETVLAVGREEPGNILVFLPGAPEIRQAAKRLAAAGPGPEWIIAPLFGQLSQEEQDRAVMAPPEGKRKIVLATSIAETSLTIDGIRVVVDSGLSRLPRYDVRSAMTRLTTMPVSRASADQRRGRAGRTGPGICLRLWSHGAHHTLPAEHRPEILEADLAGLALELAIWGERDVHRLRWLDPPPPKAFQVARELLRSLDALDQDNVVTEHGRRMAGLPLHPRLAHMLMAAAEIGQGPAACDLAALLTERDGMHIGAVRRDEDLQTRFDLLTAFRRGQPLAGFVDASVFRRVIRTADHLGRLMACPKASTGTDSIGRLLAFAYPDRVAQQRPGRRGRYLLAGGKGAFLEPDAPLAAEPYLVAVELDGDRREARIFRAASHRLDLLMEQFAKRIQIREVIQWDPGQQAVVSRREICLGALILQREQLPSPDNDRVRKALINGIRMTGISCLPWTKSLRAWQRRVCFLQQVDPGGNWPDVTDSGLEIGLTEWLGPHLGGLTRLRELERVDLQALLSPMLSYAQRKRMDELAPTHFVVPSGSRIPIDYSGDSPVLAVRLQEMFGLGETPAIVEGRHPLTIHLLSPAARPVQITRDLAGFWRTGYLQVKKELKGRYPRHYWPDDPLQAEPTSRAKSKR